MPGWYAKSYNKTGIVDGQICSLYSSGGGGARYVMIWVEMGIWPMTPATHGTLGHIPNV